MFCHMYVCTTLQFLYAQHDRLYAWGKGTGPIYQYMVYFATTKRQSEVDRQNGKAIHHHHDHTTGNLYKLGPGSTHWPTKFCERSAKKM